MPDFNYGDFTQQGIENKVTLKARLNKRRYVTLDLQSDVEGPNLTISGNVHDELNNIDYPIGSAPNGNIEITENGENINVAPYATATVNVAGGGDNPLDQCKKCVLTLTNGDSQDIASALLIEVLANLTLVEITVADGRLDSNYSFIDNQIPSFNISPGDSMTFNLYYTKNDTPGAPIGIAFNTQQFTFAFSNINNMEILDVQGVSGYKVTNTDNDSAITVTATVTGQ